MTHISPSNGTTGFRHCRRPGKSLPRIFLSLIFLGSIVGAQVFADHEIDHRYKIEGYILDSSGDPVSGTGVSIYVRGTAIGSTETDGDGYYVVRAHLHDTHFGQKLKIVAGDQNFESRVTFRRGDKTTERIHYINIVGGKMNETELDRPRIPSWVFVLAGSIVVVAVLVFFRPEIRKLRRRFKQEPDKPAPGTNPKPKPKKKKKRRKR